MDAWVTRRWPETQNAWRSQRLALADLLASWRDTGSAVDPTVLSTGLHALHATESASTIAMGEAYGSAWAALSAEERVRRRASLRAFLAGDLSELPPERIGASTIQLGTTVHDELRTRDISFATEFASYVIAYATFTAGPDCTASFDPRQDFHSAAAAWYGFAPWVQAAFFNLQTGIEDPLTPQQELAGLVESLEQAAGIDPAPFLEDTVAARRAWTTARLHMATATRDFALAVVDDADRTPAREALEAIRDEQAAAEQALVEAELAYLFALRDTLTAAQLDDIERWIDCLESPSTQALRGAGGFDAIGGGTCLP